MRRLFVYVYTRRLAKKHGKGNLTALDLQQTYLEKAKPPSSEVERA